MRPDKRESVNKKVSVPKTFQEKIKKLPNYYQRKSFVLQDIGVSVSSQRASQVGFSPRGRRWHKHVLAATLLCGRVVVITTGLGLFGHRHLVLFTRDNVDQKIKHICLDNRSGNIASLQCPTLVFFGMDPAQEIGDKRVILE